jgi:hypothetical protein
VPYTGSTSLSSLYPGDAYVDQVALDGYNRGTTQTWIRDMFAALAQHPEIRGFTWFDCAKETDWRIDSSAASLDTRRRQRRSRDAAATSRPWLAPPTGGPAAPGRGW